MSSRLEWTGLGPFVVVCGVAVALTAWQVSDDRSVFEPYFGPMAPVAVMVGMAVVGVVAMAYLQASSDLAVVGPGDGRSAAAVVAWAVPLLAAAAIAADVVFRFAEDTNVAWPDALRFYPAIGVFVDVALRTVPIAVLVAIFGMPSDVDSLIWRIAVPVASIEAVLQAAYASSVGTTIFSAIHLMVFGVAQVWMFWRFGFIWMLGFRLAYYSLWHLVWGAARLEVLFR